MDASPSMVLSSSGELEQVLRITEPERAKAPAIMPLVFNKYHGIGNDFLVLEVQRPDAISIDRAIELCNRHFGIGGDGVLLISPPESSEAKARMTVINADGSTPEMCGNGLRCVALHLARRTKKKHATFLIDTDAGALICEVERSGDSGKVKTDIGQGTLIGGLEHSFAGEIFDFTRVITGNPHAICFRQQIDDAQLDRLGPELSKSIPGGANVEIATVESQRRIKVTVWERGVGRTLACGTGAAATAIAAASAQMIPFDEVVEVELPGGVLEITVTRSLRAELRGPAQWVYSGSTPI